MTPSEMRAKEPKELGKLLDENKRRFFELQLQFVSGQLAKTDGLRKMRKDIAQLSTILKEKEKGIHVSAAKKEAAPKETVSKIKVKKEKKTNDRRQTKKR